MMLHRTKGALAAASQEETTREDSYDLVVNRKGGSSYPTHEVSSGLEMAFSTRGPLGTLLSQIL